jgi:hypothetical protein
MINMIIHLMIYNSGMFHDRINIEKDLLIDKIPVNMMKHMYDIEDLGICLFYHMKYIDTTEIHYTLNIAYHTIDN